MKNYASKKCAKGKIAYRTPSRFRANSSIRSRNLGGRSKKRKSD